MQDENKLGRPRRIKQACSVVTACMSLACAALAQGTLIVDQKSSSDSNSGEFITSITGNQPIGQSFTPSLDGVAFIRLFVADNAIDGIGSTIFVNLRFGSITGAAISSTSPVALPDMFNGAANFFFGTTVPLVPGTTYYLQPVVQSGANFGAAYDSRFLYPGGNAFFNGAGDTFYDLWFQEGIVPEPSTLALLLVGGGAVAYVRRKSDRKGH